MVLSEDMVLKLKVKEEGIGGVGPVTFAFVRWYCRMLCGVSLLLLEIVLVFGFYIAGCVGARGSWSSLSDQIGFWAIHWDLESWLVK
jgi:hypothetical protein